MTISQKLNRCGSLWSALLCGSLAAACSGTIATPTEEFPPRQGTAADDEDDAAPARQTATASAATTSPAASAASSDVDEEEAAAEPIAPAASDDEAEDEEDVLPVAEPAAAALTFEDDVWPIFNAKCGPCHVNAGFGGQNIGSDDIAQALDDSRAFEAGVLADMESGSMPPGTCGGPPGSSDSCVSEEEFETIEEWYAAGAPE